MVDRNWQFSPRFLLLLWEFWEHSFPCGFVTVFAVYTHTQSPVHKKKPQNHVFSVYARIQHSSWAVQSITTLRSVLDSLSSGWQNAILHKKMWDQLFPSCSLLWLLLLSSSLAVWCSCMSCFWPHTLIRSLWPKQGTGLLSLQHGGVSVFGVE